jgi:hypothetical protein
MNSKRIEYINVECLTSKNGYDNSCRLKQVLPLCKKQSYLPAHADCFNSVLWELQQLHVKGWPTNSLKKIEYIFYISCYLFCISCFQRLIYIYPISTYRKKKWSGQVQSRSWKKSNWSKMLLVCTVLYIVENASGLRVVVWISFTVILFNPFHMLTALSTIWPGHNCAPGSN